MQTGISAGTAHFHGRKAEEQEKPPRGAVSGSKSNSPSSHGAGEPWDNPPAPLCHGSVPPPLWEPPRLGIGKGQGSCWRKGPLGLCSCHAGHISPIPPSAPATISKDFPAFLITPFPAPVFQEARGFFQCPDSSDLLAKLFSAGISSFPDSGGVKL